MKEKSKEILFILAILLIIVLRFISVFYVPDVFSDEEDILNHINSIIQFHTDADGNRLPLFAKVGFGLSTYTYLYPMSLLGSVFGVSANRLRFLQQGLTIFSCFLTSTSVYLFSNKKNIFKICLFVSLTLPWGFVQANRIWDPAFVPLYFSLYFFCFSLLINKKEMKGSVKSLVAVFSFSLLVFLAIVYPPCRIPAVLMWIYSLVWVIKEKIVVKTKDIVLIFVFSTLFALPLAMNILRPEFNTRSADLLVFQGENFWLEGHDFVRNFAKMLSLDFFFVGGDKNYRHCVPYFGVLGTISIVPIIEIINNKKSQLTKYMFFTILATSLSVALTDEGIPHSLRGCLEWLPAAIIISEGWNHLYENGSRTKRCIIICSLVLAFCIYFGVYILYYSMMKDVV